MKQLTDLIEVSKGDLPSVYCDMDMVLCNFMKKADEVTGGRFVTADKVERWKQISSTKDFWANLDKTKKDFKWLPETSLHSGISKLINHK